MAKARKRRSRLKNQDNSRRFKKRVSILTSDKIEYVDWKDHNLLRKFMSDRAKIRSRRVTGNNTQQQKLVASAIKLAREMALLPYSSRVTTQRQHKEQDGFRDSFDSVDGSPQSTSRPTTGADPSGQAQHEKAGGREPATTENPPRRSGAVRGNDQRADGDKQATAETESS